MNGKRFYAIKVIFVHIIGYVLCVFQAYVSMSEYKEHLSSTGLNSSYGGDVLAGSLFFYFLSLLIYSLFRLVRFLLKAKKLKTNHKAILFTAIYVVACFMVNHEIFVSRVTSWSTFTTFEELTGTLQKSYLLILITSVIFYYMVRFTLADKKTDSARL